MDRCPPKDFSFLSLPLCRYCFIEQAFQFEKSLLVKTQPVYDAIKRTVSARWAEFSPMSFLTLSF